MTVMVTASGHGEIYSLRSGGRGLVPGCAAEGMAVPLAVKELRPLRGACGVLDREPPARHRQKGPAGKEPASGDAAQPYGASVETRLKPARLRATHVPSPTWAAPVTGGARLRAQGSELRVRDRGSSSWFSSKQPVAGSSPARRAILPRRSTGCSAITRKKVSVRNARLMPRTCHRVIFVVRDQDHLKFALRWRRQARAGGPGLSADR